MSTMPRTSHHESPVGERRGKREHSTVFLERMMEGHHSSQANIGSLNSNIGESFERHGGAHMGFSKQTDTILILEVN